MGSPAIEELTCQMKDLMINQATFQQQIVSQLSNSNSGDWWCYLCNKSGTHQLGITNCPKLSALIGEGFVKYNEQGKVVKKDGSPLPWAAIGSGGIAKVLRDKWTTDKGKARESNEACFTGSSYTNHVELLYEGQGVLSDDTVGLAFGNNNIAYPVTHQQKKDLRMDPLKHGGEKNKITKVPPVPDKWQTNVVPPQKPKATDNVVMKDIPAKLQPHPANMEQGWKDQSKAKRQSEPRTNDEANKTKGGGWHFSSIIQDSIDGADVQDHILNTQVMLMLKEILGVSVDLQKRFSNLVRTKRIDNQVKNSLILHDFQHDRDCDQMIQINKTTWVNSEESYSQADVSDTPFVPAKAQLSFDLNNDVMNIMSCYAHLVMVDIPNTLAFTTGRFEAWLGRHKIVFMLDTGSELNLISESFFWWTSLTMEVNSIQWSLKGVNSDAVPLVSLLQNVEVDISGHWFNHHFFVSSEGTGNQDVILGQPWLVWYMANISYMRKGSMLGRMEMKWITSAEDESHQLSPFSWPPLMLHMDGHPFLQCTCWRSWLRWWSQVCIRKLKMGVQLRHDLCCGSPVPLLGQSFHSLASYLHTDNEKNFLLECLPPETYDFLMQQAIYAMLRGSVPIDSPWTNHVQNKENLYLVGITCKYKPVHHRVCPVLSYMPDPKGQEFQPIPIPPITPLLLNPPCFADFICTGWLTKEHLETILSWIPSDFLTERETDLLAYVIQFSKCFGLWQ